MDKMLKDEHLSVPANIQEKLYLKPQSLEGLLATLYHSLSSFKASPLKVSGLSTSVVSIDKSIF